MAVPHSKRSHAHQFINQLTKNERNSLRILLLTKSGLADLREALDLQHMRVVSIEQERTGHALRGTTAELFRGSSVVARVDVKLLDSFVEVSQ